MLEAFQGDNVPDFRLIRSVPSSGAWNMAVDEALMESAGIPGAPATVRLYSFAPPTLSVGRFQRTKGVFNLGLLESDEVEFVRRPSGGQAVLHSSELTYSVVIGRHSLSGVGKRSVYRLIVPVLLGGLARLAIPGKETEGGAVSRDPDCFAVAGEYEIDTNEGRKLIGSAQMVSRTSVLQHGSIPLDSSYRAISRYIDRGAVGNSSSSLAEELGREVPLSEAMTAYAKGIAEDLGAVDADLTPSEKKRAEELLANQYGRDEWNRKY
jgi:lipoyl(octanoyl) transferase